jgi:hypothetical protein
MKKAVFLGIALLLISSASFAQAPPVGYIGLFMEEAHTTWCTDESGFPGFEMWIWILPSVNGCYGAEFRVSYPANSWPGTVTPHDDPPLDPSEDIISVALGDLANGISIGLLDCFTDWLWTHHQSIVMTDANPSQICIIGHPDTDLYQLATCDEDHTLEPCIAYNCIMAGCAQADPCCTTANRTASWGAIKSLYE